MEASSSPVISPVTIGWKEYVNLPDLGVRGLKAKIDTGARTSSLHISSLAVLEQHADGTATLEFRIPLSRAARGAARDAVLARARMLREIRVTDSGGHQETRPLIETTLVLGPVTKRIFLTLTDRSGMLFRIILGRKALEDDFLVNVAAKYLTGGAPGPRGGSR